MITEWQETHERGVTLADGFRAAAVRCGLKTAGDDLGLIVCDRPAALAGMFTSNLVRASCVTWSESLARNGSARAIVVNAGNANACNGEAGDRDNRRMAEVAAESLGIQTGEVCVASTGVIGNPMPMAQLSDGIRRAASVPESGSEADAAFARAIMTTDTRPKMVAATVTSSSLAEPFHVGGSCKGAGMIAPRLIPHATMLCFLTTDANAEPAVLQEALEQAAARTFNRVTVDGDTSTNDMLLLLSTRTRGAAIQPGSEAFTDLAAGLERVCRYLAREIARDGEGATKLVEVVVRGAATDADVDRIGRTIAESPLVKTALFGCDPNWGRILAAAGRSGVRFDPLAAEAFLGAIPVYCAGTRADFDASAAHAYLKQPEVRIILDLHAGDAQATFWTCDYSYDYVRINAEYHT